MSKTSPTQRTLALCNSLRISSAFCFGIAIGTATACVMFVVLEEYMPLFSFGTASMAFASLGVVSLSAAKDIERKESK